MGYNLTVDDFRVEFPKFAVNTDTLIQTHLQQPVSYQSTLYSIGPSMIAYAYNEHGDKITQFSKAWDLSVMFGTSDIERYFPNTLSFYSHKENSLVWEKETTIIDLMNGTAKASLDHMTEFALMGEKRDNQAPITTASILGTLHASGVYTSDISITLTAVDGPSVYSQGVDYLLYKIGSTDWVTYVAPFKLSGAGSYLLSYFAADKDDNGEKINTQTLTIDFTPLTPTSTPTPTNTPTPSNTPTPTTVYSLPIIPYLSSTPTPTPTSTPTTTFVTQSHGLPPPDLSDRKTQSFLASSKSDVKAPTVLSAFSNNNVRGVQDENISSESASWIMVGAILVLLIYVISTMLHHPAQNPESKCQETF